MSHAIPVDKDADELEALLRSTAKDLAEMASVVDGLLAACESALDIAHDSLQRDSSCSIYDDLMAAIARAKGGRP